MKKVFFFTLIAVLSSSFILSSCSKDDDPTRPVVKDLDPEEGERLEIGKDVHFAAHISDDSGLKNYSIDIHHNFDNHGDHKSTKDEAPAETEPFIFLKTWTADMFGESLDGRKEAQLHHHEIMIKNKSGKPVAPGNYHFTLYVTNKDERTTVVSRNVILTNDEVGDPHHHH